MLFGSTEVSCQSGRTVGGNVCSVYYCKKNPVSSAESALPVRIRMIYPYLFTSLVGNIRSSVDTIYKLYDTMWMPSDFLQMSSHISAHGGAVDPKLKLSRKEVRQRGTNRQ